MSKSRLESYFDQQLARPDKQLRRTTHVQMRVEDRRTGMSVDAFKRAFIDHLHYIQGVSAQRATLQDFYMALSYAVRDRLVHRWLKTLEAFNQQNGKAVFYLSAEFLTGRHLANNLLCIGGWEQATETLAEHNIDLYDLLEQEAEPGLGNGGLGRLAACFLDSLSTSEIPAVGYGIRYEYGIFRQRVIDGWQVEAPDQWLLLGNPWEIRRPERTVEVKFGGWTEANPDGQGQFRVRWIPDFTVLGVPYDTMVPGYGTDLVNTLRLWGAQASQDFDFSLFNSGDFSRAVANKTASETISKVLYPNDNTPQGRELRFKQQYFFVSCCLQDILSSSQFSEKKAIELPEHAVIQLNDTHPSIAIAELMRLLVDEHRLEWEEAWKVTTKTFAYTNHTLLSEALEKWPVSLFAKLLPRHLDIIYEINRRFLEVIRVNFPNDESRTSRMSLIEESHERYVRMANLACVGSKAINGVAALHTDLLKQDVLKDFYELWPDKFHNITNGVTPRRWILSSNPKLTSLISGKIGDQWIRQLEKLKELEEYASNNDFCKSWQEVKQENKNDLTEYILRRNHIEVDPNSIFDVQVKRIHEYKRQLLNALYIATLYRRLKENPKMDFVPRTFILAGKAAPGYFMAKLIIKFYNSVADTVNRDPEVSKLMKVIFLENFSVSLGEQIYAAANLSEQISTAGKEASGTGNMKFAMNGALTIGTLDGANIEIRDAVGKENFFLFGHTVEELSALRKGNYNPREWYERNAELKALIDSIADGYFSPGAPDLFEPIVQSLLHHDAYFLFADYASYLDCQASVSEAYKNKSNWTKMSILNTARSGYFSSDRSIAEYLSKIWKAKPLNVTLDDTDK